MSLHEPAVKQACDWTVYNYVTIVWSLELSHDRSTSKASMLTYNSDESPPHVQ